VFKGHKIADMNNKLHNLKFPDILPKVKAASFDINCAKTDIRGKGSHNDFFNSEIETAFNKF